MSVKRLLDCTPSELAQYTKAELLDAIAGSEGRVLACETIGLTPPLLVDVTNAEYAASLSADILLLNMFDVQHPVINALPKVPEVETVRELKRLTGRVVGINLEPTLTDAVGQTYNYLYWEGVSRTEYDFSQGFCVPGRDTAAFLEDTLATLGLNRREANEFIVYWLPHMEGNAYNLIAFQTSSYTDHARLTITPEPDTLIRVFMAYRPLEKAVEIAPQTLTAPERTGFTAVEWGGAECK